MSALNHKNNEPGYLLILCTVILLIVFSMNLKAVQKKDQNENRTSQSK